MSSFDEQRPQFIEVDSGGLSDGASDMQPNQAWPDPAGKPNKVGRGRWLENALMWLVVPMILATIYAVGDLLILLGRRLWTGEWSFISLGEGLSWLGWQLDWKVQHWPLSVVVLILALALLGGNDASSSAKAVQAPAGRAERQPVRLPRYLWPRSRQVETTVLVRLGRAVHWVTIALAAVILALAVFLGWESLARTADDAYFGTALLIGFGGALALALVGRGFRYILADE